MARTEDGLRVLPPQAVDEETPLLNDAPNTSMTEDGEDPGLEAQAEQERREHDVGAIAVTEEPPFRKVLAIMSCLWVSTFFAALDTTVVATLSGPISTSFSSGTAFSWIASGYLIANAACQPLSGKLTDIYGRRAGLVFANTFFAAGTLMCGLAPNAATMIAGRVVAGMGGGCLNTVSVFIASDLVPLRKRGLWQGFANVIFGLGMGLGGIYGGLINDHLSWRYAFYIQVPFIVVGGVLSFLLVNIPVKETDTSKIKRVDFLGAFTLVASLVLLLLGLNSGGNTVPWNHPLVYVSLPLSAVFLALFVYIEQKIAHEPIIPVHLLFDRSVLGCCLTLWFLTMAMFCLMYYLPIFFQVIRGVSATGAGVLFIPQAIGTASGSVSTGFIMRVTGKYWWPTMASQVINLLALSLIAGLMTPSVSTAAPFVLFFLAGFGYGCVLTTTFIALLSAVDQRWQAVITSASYAFRSTGSSIGISIASTIFQNVLRQRLFARFGDIPGAWDEIRRIRDSVDELHRLPPGWHDGVISSYAEALRGVWIAALGFCVLAVTASLFMKEYKLHTNLERK